MVDEDAVLSEETVITVTWHTVAHGGVRAHGLTLAP